MTQAKPSQPQKLASQGVVASPVEEKPSVYAEVPDNEQSASLTGGQLLTLIRAVRLRWHYGLATG